VYFYKQKQDMNWGEERIEEKKRKKEKAKRKKEKGKK